MIGRGIDGDLCREGIEAVAGEQALAYAFGLRGRLDDDDAERPLVGGRARCLRRRESDCDRHAQGQERRP